MKLIESRTIATPQASIAFTSIPQTFTDLVIVASGRSERTAGFEDYLITFNGSSANFSWIRLGGQGSGSPYSDSGTTGRLGQIDTDFATANTFGNLTAYISNYTAATNKSISVDFVTENNATQAFQEIVALLWSNTAAINSFTLTTTNGFNFKAGTIISLYGVLKGSDGIVTTSP
jgi:hypothetical protein